MKILQYPLYQLNTNLITPFEIDNGVAIIENKIVLSDNENNVSKKDQIHIQETKYCLSIDQNVITSEEASVLIIRMRLGVGG